MCKYMLKYIFKQHCTSITLFFKFLSEIRYLLLQVKAMRKRDTQRENFCIHFEVIRGTEKNQIKYPEFFCNSLCKTGASKLTYDT